jgi:hypothetical protein
MAGFEYRLYLADEEDIGTFTMGVPDWDVGMEFISDDQTRFRILNMSRTRRSTAISTTARSSLALVES